MLECSDGKELAVVVSSFRSTYSSIATLVDSHGRQTQQAKEARLQKPKYLPTVTGKNRLMRENLLPHVRDRLIAC